MEMKQGSNTLNLLKSKASTFSTIITLVQYSIVNNDHNVRYNSNC